MTQFQSKFHRNWVHLFTTKPSGNGLGLAIVRRIVEAHSGELLIYSEQERGTIVSIQLPLIYR